MCTLRNQYMKDIIANAHKARKTVADDDSNNQGISISEAWMAELQKHPYHSSKLWLLIHIEKLALEFSWWRSQLSCTERKKNEKKRSWRRDSGHPVKPVMKIKKQAGYKKETEPWRWEIHRGASTETRWHIDEGRSQMITYINLTTNTNFQYKLTHISHTLSHSHYSHSV